MLISTMLFVTATGSNVTWIQVNGAGDDDVNGRYVYMPRGEVLWILVSKHPSNKRNVATTNPAIAIAIAAATPVMLVFEGTTSSSTPNTSSGSYATQTGYTSMR